MYIYFTIARMAWSLKGNRRIKKIRRTEIWARRTFCRKLNRLNIEVFIPFSGHDDGIFVTNTSSSWQIEAWLDRDGHPCTENDRVVFALKFETRVLVRLKTDPMS
jgi:hypothetical protein